MKYCIVFILTGLTIVTKAQQMPQSTFFVYDNMTINPGYAGSQDGICVNVLARNQWMGFPGNQNVQKFDVHMPFKLFGWEHGAGFALYNDNIGLQRDINVALSYAFLKPLGNGKLGVGLGGGFDNTTISGSWNPFDGTNDPNIPNTSSNGKIAINLNLGAFYKTKQVFLGLSAMNLFEGERRAQTTDGIERYAYTPRHYNLTAGYNYQLNNPLFELQPALLIQSVGSSTQINVNATLRYRGKVWGGVGYRITDAITTFIGVELIEGLNAGISYDITTSKIANFSDGSMEILVRYIFKVGVKKEYDHYKSIRYL